MGTLFPQVVDLLRPGVDYADHLRRIAERALTEIEQPRVEKLRLRPDPAAELIREPLIFRRRDGGWRHLAEDRKSVVLGNGVSVRVDLGVRRLLKKNKKNT